MYTHHNDNCHDHASLSRHDLRQNQDEALKFYTEKLGFENAWTPPSAFPLADGRAPNQKSGNDFARTSLDVRCRVPRKI